MVLDDADNVFWFQPVRRVERDAAHDLQVQPLDEVSTHASA
jgi:hypothetical protein